MFSEGAIEALPPMDPGFLFGPQKITLNSSTPPPPTVPGQIPEYASDLK